MQSAPAPAPTPGLDRLFAVRRAITEEDRRRVYAFRYAVYVREMGRLQRWADHGRGCIEEPQDRTGQVYLAEGSRGEVVGTVRTNYCRDGGLAEPATLYRLDWALAALPDATSISTKLIVAPRYRTGLRSGMLGAALATAAYRDGLAAGIALDFCDCSTARIESFFKHLGYRRYDEDAEHPELGTVRLLVLQMLDAPKLEAVGSPFLRVLRQHAADAHTAELARRAAAEYRRAAFATGFLED